MENTTELYRVLPEFQEFWGSDVDDDTAVSLDDIKFFASEWGVSVDELLQQVEYFF